MAVSIVFDSYSQMRIASAIAPGRRSAETPAPEDCCTMCKEFTICTSSIDLAVIAETGHSLSAGSAVDQ